MKQNVIKLLFILIVASSGLLLIGSLNRAHNWGGDFAAYIMQTRSIIEGTTNEFIVNNRFIVEQSSEVLGPIAYPWGFPILLLPFYAIFGFNTLALKSAGAISFMLFLILLWFSFKEDHSLSAFICLVSLLAFNPILINFSNQIMSDLPFMLASTLCITLIDKVIVKGRRLTTEFFDFFLIGLVTALAFLIRTNGILLLLTLALTQLFYIINKQKKHKSENDNFEIEGVESDANKSHLIKIVYFTPYIVFVFVVITQTLLLPSGGSYESHLDNISLAMIQENFHYYLNLPGHFFYNFPYSFVLFGTSIPLAISGVARKLPSIFPAFIYTLLTILLYIIWPYKQGLRFLFPVIPFYISFFFYGLDSFLEDSIKKMRMLRAAICYGPVILVILSFFISSLNIAHSNSSYTGEINFGPFKPTSQKMFSYIINHTDPNSTIVFFKPRVMKLLTDRQSIRINKNKHVYRGDYLCVYLAQDQYARSSQLPFEYINSLVSKKLAKQVYRNNDFIIYRLSNKDEKPIQNMN